MLGDAGQDLDQLQLIVQVVLEPEHGLAPGRERREEGGVGRLEAGQDRVLRPEAGRREERRSGTAHGGGVTRRDRPFVQHVAPHDHLAGQRGALDRPGDRIAVHDVRGVEGGGGHIRPPSIRPGAWLRHGDGGHVSRAAKTRAP